MLESTRPNVIFVGFEKREYFKWKKESKMREVTMKDIIFSPVLRKKSFGLKEKFWRRKRWVADRSSCIFRKGFCVQGFQSISTLLAFYGPATFGYLRAPIGLHKNHALSIATCCVQDGRAEGNTEQKKRRRVTMGDPLSCQSNQGTTNFMKLTYFWESNRLWIFFPLQE